MRLTEKPWAWQGYISPVEPYPPVSVFDPGRGDREGLV